MKKYLVYVKDQFGAFWSVAVDAKEVPLIDVFEFASLKTFGGRVIGVKDFYNENTFCYNHGDVLPGLL